MTDKQTHTVHSGHVRIDLYNGTLELDAQGVHSAMLRALDSIITDVEKEKADLEKENKRLHETIDNAAQLIEESCAGRATHVQILNALHILKNKGEGDDI